MIKEIVLHFNFSKEVILFILLDFTLLFKTVYLMAKVEDHILAWAMAWSESYFKWSLLWCSISLRMIDMF